MTAHPDGRVPDFRGRQNMDPAERFYAKIRVDSETGCWLWMGYRAATGYGRFNPGRPARCTYAHRWSYQHHVAPIPLGYQIDHLCRNRSCCNPEHLEAVTQQENIRRGSSYSTVASRTGKCRVGHSLPGYYNNGPGKRVCTICRADRERRTRGAA